MHLPGCTSGEQRKRKTNWSDTDISQVAFMAETLTSNLISASSNPSWLACEKDYGSEVPILIDSVLNEWKNLEGPQNLNKIISLRADKKL